MSIIQTITSASRFHVAFYAAGRGDQFSRAAIDALFEYYDELGEDIELDPVAICCEWAEYESPEDAAKELGWSPDDEDEDAAIEWLQDNTLVLFCEGGGVVVSG